MSPDTQALDSSIRVSPSDAFHASGGVEYRMLANALPHVIWICNASGQLEWVNDRWYELTGLTEAETLHDKGALDAVHPDDRDTIYRTWAQILESGASGEMEYRIHTRHGTYCWHVARIAPVRDAENRVARWIASTYDIQRHKEAEEALRASEHRFATVFNLSPQATAITRYSDGVFLSINDAFLTLTGFGRDEVIGKSTVQLGIWSDVERADFIVAAQDSARGGAELPFRAKDGTKLSLMVASVLTEIDGVPCLVNAINDVTARRAAEAALRASVAEARARAHELAALMDAVPAAVVITDDSESRFVRGNRAAHTLLRMPMAANLSKTGQDESLTRHFTFLVDGVEIPRNELPLQRAARGEESQHLERTLRFDDGTEIFVIGGAVTLREPDGTPRGAIAAFVDVTQLKQAERAMREADQRKDEFLALLSHELRNPLAPILISARLLARNADAEAQYDLDIIIRQVKHLVRLVDDLLDVSRVARGRVTLTKKHLDLAMVVSRAAEAAEPLIEERQHKLVVLVPPNSLTVDADEVRLTQVINNLLANAAHYTPPGGTITVTARREMADVVLSVRDTGMGIDAELLPEVFDTFVKGRRAPERKQGGLGLGLALVRTLTELHGGTVTAFSEGQDRGSEFVVRLPAQENEAKGRTTPVPGTLTRALGSDAETRRVLCVDDNHDIVTGVARVLTIAGFDVRVATDPLEALALAKSFRPQIAILDIGLPVMDGYTLGRELRARQPDDPPVLIALTGFSQTRDRQKSEEAQFAMHLVKPIDAEELVRLLDQVAVVGTVNA